MDRENLCLSLFEIESGLCFPHVRRLGILGGSFNPVHYGHLILGGSALKAMVREEQVFSEGKRDIIKDSDFPPLHAEGAVLSSECIVFLPTSVPYHKESLELLPFSERAAMLSLALKEENERYRNETKKEREVNECRKTGKESLSFFYSSIEGERSGNSYTYDSALILKKAFPNAAFSLIIGTDEYFTLEKWYRIKDLGEILSFLVANRNGEVKESSLRERQSFLKKEYGLHSSFLDMKRIEYSSSLIRKFIKENVDTAGMLPKTVLEYIHLNRFYI